MSPPFPSLSLCWVDILFPCFMHEVIEVLKTYVIYQSSLFFFSTLLSIQNLSSLTRDRVCAPCSGIPLDWTAREFSFLYL